MLTVEVLSEAGRGALPPTVHPSSAWFPRPDDVRDSSKGTRCVILLNCPNDVESQHGILEVSPESGFQLGAVFPSQLCI